jgi:hypothetical protein
MAGVQIAFASAGLGHQKQRFIHQQGLKLQWIVLQKKMQSKMLYLSECLRFAIHLKSRNDRQSMEI